MTFTILMAKLAIAAALANMTPSQHPSEPVSPQAECERVAELHYEVALSAGLVADAAWEDSYASCRGE